MKKTRNGTKYYIVLDDFLSTKYWNCKEYVSSIKESVGMTYSEAKREYPAAVKSWKYYPFSTERPYILKTEVINYKRNRTNEIKRNSTGKKRIKARA